MQAARELNEAQHRKVVALAVGGAPFTLPVEGGKIDEEAYRRLMVDMAKLAPPGWEFPPLPKR